MPSRATTPLDHAALRRLLREQAGMVARHQLASIGATRADVRRMLARRELVEVHRRVYVSHTGPPE
jgi:predicted component of type VI protein secretion system